MPAKSTASWGKKATLDDVRTNPLNGAAGTQGVNGGDPGLQLWVRSGTPRGSEIPSAEVASARRDMRYGSFRAGMKYTDEPGTCGAFFWASLSPLPSRSSSPRPLPKRPRIPLLTRQPRSTSTTPKKSMSSSSHRESSNPTNHPSSS